MPYILILVGAVLLVALFLRRSVITDSAEPQSADLCPTLPEQNLIPLKTTEDGRNVITLRGVDYFAYEGEYSEDIGIRVWDWHGRMGNGLGFLVRDNALFYEGELYTLRGREDILLAFLPRDGWPITDMQIFLPQGGSLPAVEAGGFCKAEVFRLEGEYEEETYEKVIEISDAGQIATLAECWLNGPCAEPPEGEYERYRIRLYSAQIEGLYVNVNLNRSESTGQTFVEKYRFAGDTPLPEGWKEIL